MRTETERQSIIEVSKMAAESLNPEEHNQFCEVFDRLVMVRDIPNVPLLSEYKIDKTVSCTKCRANTGAWVYCKIIPQMLEIDGFDETGELHGCNKYFRRG